MTDPAGNVPSPGAPNPAQEHHDTPNEPEREVRDVPGQEETFDRAYVERLRTEAADHRVKARRADELQTRLLDAVIREGTAGVLEDPDDLWRDRDVSDFLDEDGYPSVERVREIAQELAKARPHLAARRRPLGDIDQGARPEQDATPNLAAMLRERAG